MGLAELRHRVRRTVLKRFCTEAIPVGERACSSWSVVRVCPDRWTGSYLPDSAHPERRPVGPGYVRVRPVQSVETDPVRPQLPRTGLAHRPQQLGASAIRFPAPVGGLRQVRLPA